MRTIQKATIAGAIGLAVLGVGATAAGAASLDVIGAVQSADERSTSERSKSTPRPDRSELLTEALQGLVE
jgi:hypothetical protein